MGVSFLLLDRKGHLVTIPGSHPAIKAIRQDRALVASAAQEVDRRQFYKAIRIWLNEGEDDEK